MKKIHASITATLLCLLLITASTATAATVDSGVVNINTGTVEQLCLLPGVGQHTARQIISHRQANGVFQSVNDLLQVKGIGNATLERLRAHCVTKGQTTLQPES